MAKILFAPVQVAGHFFPTIPVAHYLKMRGHEIIYCTELNMKEIVEGEGFRYFRVGPGVWPGNLAERFPRVLELRGNPRIHYILKNIYLGFVSVYIRDSLPFIEKEKPDLFVFDSLSFPGPIIAELTGIPWVTTSMFIGMFPSRELPPWTLGWPPPRNVFQQFFYQIVWQAFIFYCRRYDRIINRVRKEHGLKPKRQAFLKSALSPYLYLTFTAFDLEYHQSRLPPQVHLVGPCVWDRPRSYQVPDWLAHFPERPPTVYITIGTVASVFERRFFQMVIEAFRGMPEVQGVMTISYPGQDINRQEVPENLRVEEYIPNSVIVPKVDLVVHHGGFSTTMDCLINGKPAVVIPMDGDQNENGRRVQVAGAGYYLSYKKLNAELLREKIREALRDEEIKAKAVQLSRALGKYDGPERSADLVERLLETGQPVLR